VWRRRSNGQEAWGLAAFCLVGMLGFSPREKWKKRRRRERAPIATSSGRPCTKTGPAVIDHERAAAGKGKVTESNGCSQKRELGLYCMVKRAFVIDLPPQVAWLAG
jgi:hypothetical protein